VVLELGTLAAGERVRMAYEKTVGALAVSCQWEAVASASCLYSRPLKMVASPIRREEG
jgi:hypothetical protein